MYYIKKYDQDEWKIQDYRNCKNLFFFIYGIKYPTATFSIIYYKSEIHLLQEKVNCKWGTDNSLNQFKLLLGE